MSDTTAAVAPRLGVTPAGVRVGSEPEMVEAAWQLTNLSDEPIELLESWLPHGRFFADREVFQPALDLPAGEGRPIRRRVRCAGEPGEVVENAFLNLRVRFRGEPWRTLIRMRVERMVAGSVVLAVAAITTHRIGFAQAGERFPLPGDRHRGGADRGGAG